MKIANIITSIFFIICVVYCKGKTLTQNEKTLVENNLPEINKGQVNDSVIILEGHRLTLQPKNICKQIKSKSDQEDFDFILTQIGYFKTDTIMVNQLKMPEYYKMFLQKTYLFEYGESNFYKNNFTFSLTQPFIKNYGKCFIGTYYFPAAINAAQRRAFVIINVERKEISIWNFDELIVTENGLSCDFNVRGKHTIYKLIYSLECKSFIPK